MKKITTILSISITPIALIVFSIGFVYAGIILDCWLWLCGLSLPLWVYMLYDRLRFCNKLEVCADCLHIKNMVFGSKTTIYYSDIEYWEDAIDLLKGMDNSIFVKVKYEKKQVQIIRRTDATNFDKFRKILIPDYALARFLSSFGMTAYILVVGAAAKPPHIPLRNKGLSFRAKRGIPLKNANADYGLIHDFSAMQQVEDDVKWIRFKKNK